MACQKKNDLARQGADNFPELPQFSFSCSSTVMPEDDCKIDFRHFSLRSRALFLACHAVALAKAGARDLTDWGALAAASWFWQLAKTVLQAKFAKA
jgi:hypothetical protein